MYRSGGFFADPTEGTKMTDDDMRYLRRLAIGRATVTLLIAATRVGQDLRRVLSTLTDEQATAGLAVLATSHARSTRGTARYVPESGIAQLVLDAADEAGYAGAFGVADAFSAADCRAALGNLLVAVLGQELRVERARAAAGSN